MPTAAARQVRVDSRRNPATPAEAVYRKPSVEDTGLAACLCEACHPNNGVFSEVLDAND